jgi:hypothetical protein
LQGSPRSLSAKMRVEGAVSHAFLEERARYLTH